MNAFKKSTALALIVALVQLTSLQATSSSEAQPQVSEQSKLFREDQAPPAPLFDPTQEVRLGVETLEFVARAIGAALYGLDDGEPCSFRTAVFAARTALQLLIESGWFEAMDRSLQVHGVELLSEARLATDETALVVFLKLSDMGIPVALDEIQRLVSISQARREAAVESIRSGGFSAMAEKALAVLGRLDARLSQEYAIASSDCDSIQLIIDAMWVAVALNSAACLVGIPAACIAAAVLAIEASVLQSYLTAVRVEGECGPDQ